MNTISDKVEAVRPGKKNYWPVLLLPLMGIGAGNVGALSFNELETASGLGEPLDLRLTASGLTEDFDPSRVRVASRETYEQLGLVWPAVLASAQVRVEGSGSEARIRIRSRGRAEEPMMTLLLEARDGSALARREYTLLLDPPVGPYVQSGSVETALRPSQPPLRAPVASAAELLAFAEGAPAAPLAARRSARPVARAPVTKAKPKIPTAKTEPRMSLRLSAAAPAGPAALALPRPASRIATPKIRYRPLKLRNIFSLNPPLPKFTAVMPVSLQLVQRIAPENLARLPPMPAPIMVAEPPQQPATALELPAPVLPSSSAWFGGGLKNLPWWLLALTLGIVLMQAIALRRRRQPQPLPGGARPERASAAAALVVPPAAVVMLPPALAPIPAPAPASRPAEAPAAPLAVPFALAADGGMGFGGPMAEADDSSEFIDITLPDFVAPLQPQPLPEPRILVLDTSLDLPRVLPTRNLPAAAPTDEDVQQDVARLLGDALRYAPQRLDLRYKLLEINHAKVQKEAFIENARLYAEEMRGQNDPAWASIVNMGQNLAPAEPLFAASGSASGGGTAPAPTSKRSGRHFDGLEQMELGPKLAELHENYRRLSASSSYRNALSKMYHRECERPTNLSRALRLSQDLGGAQILIKREDLRAARESQRLNAFGQVLLAQHLGKKRIVLGSRCGVAGEALARAAHTLGMPLRVYLPKTLASNATHPSLRLMKMLDVEIIGQPQADPRRAAMRDWLGEPEAAYYATGLDAGPPPFPAIVVDLQAVIGEEVLQQVRDVAPEGVHAAVCARASGVTAMGFLQPMVNNAMTALYCVDNGSKAITDESAHSYTREHAWMRAAGRVQYCSVPMPEVYAAAERGARLEGFPQDGCNAATLAKAISLAASLPRSNVVVAMFINALEVQSESSLSAPNSAGLQRV